MTESKLVHFTVDADFITDHARNLWSEGEFEKARDFLDTMNGITSSQCRDIFMGKKKFQEVGNTQQFILVKDNWKPNLSICHLGQYPDMNNSSEMNLAREKVLLWKKEREIMMFISEMIDTLGDVNNIGYTAIRNAFRSSPNHHQ